MIQRCSSALLLSCFSSVRQATSPVVGIDGLRQEITNLSADKRSIRNSLALMIREHLTLTTKYIEMTVQLPSLSNNQLATEAMNEGIAWLDAE